MSGPDAKAEIAELLAPSVESIIAKGLNEDFPDDHECRATHLPLDPTTLEVICRINLPEVLVDRFSQFEEFTDDGFQQHLYLKCHPKDSSWPAECFYFLNVTVTQCNNYVNAIKSMRDQLLGKDDWRTYRPTRNDKLGNYILESGDGSTLIWVRFTTVVELNLGDEDDDNCTSPWIDIKGIAAALDKAMELHKGPVSAVPKSSIDRASVPERFTVGECQLVGFHFSGDMHSHREFKLESDKAFVVVVNGIERTKGFFDTVLRLICRKKAETKLVIRTAHKSSLWPREHVYVLNS